MARQYFSDGTLMIHHSPGWAFASDSYFDPVTGEYYINAVTTEGYGYFAYVWKIFMRYSGETYTGNGWLGANGAETEYDGVLLLECNRRGCKPIEGYANISGSGVAPVTGRGTQCWMVMCCSANTDSGGVDGTDCGINHAITPVFTLLQPPVLGTVSNANPYKYQSNTFSGVSASRTSISFKYTRTGGNAETGVQYKIGANGTVHNGTVGGTTVISGLTAGTSYTIYVRIGNGAGWTSWKSITVRTLHNVPVLNITHDHITQSGLEDITISWTSDKNVQALQYTIDGSSWISATVVNNTKEGSFTISQKDSEDLFDNTEYVITVRVQGTSTYDYRWSNEDSVAAPSLSCKTDMRAVLNGESPTSFNTGDNLPIKKTNESNNNNQVRLFIGDPENSWKTEDCTKGDDYEIEFTVAEWDTAYNRFLSPSNPIANPIDYNRIPLRIKLVTFGREREYESNYLGYLLLNGNVRSAYCNPDGKVVRGKVWTRLSDNAEPVRGVSWVKTEEGWKRGK